MPNVGGKKFPYTNRGKKDAKRYARKTGQPMRGGYGQGTENRGGSRMMRNPGMAPRPRRGAGPGPRPARTIGTGMGGGGPRALPKRRRRPMPTPRPGLGRRRRG